MWNYVFFILILIISLKHHKTLANNTNENFFNLQFQINADWSKTRQYIYLKDIQPEKRFSFKSIKPKFLSTKNDINLYSIIKTENEPYGLQIEIDNNPIIEESTIYKQVFS